MAQNGRLSRLELSPVGPTGNHGNLARLELAIATNHAFLSRLELVSSKKPLYYFNGDKWVGVVLFAYSGGTWVQIS